MSRSQVLGLHVHWWANALKVSHQSVCNVRLSVSMFLSLVFNVVQMYLRRIEMIEGTCRGEIKIKVIFLLLTLLVFQRRDGICSFWMSKIHQWENKTYSLYQRAEKRLPPEGFVLLQEQTETLGSQMQHNPLSQYLHVFFSFFRTKCTKKLVMIALLY